MRGRSLCRKHWVNELVEEAIRHGIIDSKIAGYPIGGHEERAKDEIPDRKIAREVLLASVLGSGVVPAVKHRTSDHVAQRSEGPTQVRMNDHGIRPDEGTEHDKSQRLEAAGEQRCGREYLGADLIHRVHTGRAQPVKIV